METPFSSRENYKDLEKRIADFINLLKDEYPTKYIAIVAHNAPQLALEVLINEKTWSQAFKDD